MILAGTGHRPDKLGGYDDNTFQQIVELCHIVLEQQKPTEILSGMAIGFDQAWAQAAIDCNIPFHACIPFKGQELKWPLKSITKYHEILSRAKTQTFVSPEGYSAWKMQVRNQFMVDNSEALVALWNGTEGGTKNCVDYAVKKAKHVINVWQIWEKLNGR